MSRFMLIGLLVIFALPAHAARTILVFGDSLSAGYGMRQSTAWPTLLDQRLEYENSKYRVANASTSGDTTANGRSRLEKALKRHRPAIVILALGANDGLRGLPVAAMRDNLAAMIESIQNSKAKVVLVGMRLPPNYGPSYTQEFQGTFVELAHNYETALVPFLLEGFADKPGFFQADTIHPNAEAQHMILANVWPVLEPLLAKEGKAAAKKRTAAQTPKKPARVAAPAN